MNSDRRRGARPVLLILLLCIALTACSVRREAQALSPPAFVPPPPAQACASPALEPVSWDFIPILEDDLDLPSLKLAIERSQAYYGRTGIGPVRIGAESRSPADMGEALRELLSILEGSGSPEEKRGRIAERFDLYRAAGSDGRGAVLFTGYYVPMMEGSLEPTERFRYPVYGVPPESRAAASAAGKNGSRKAFPLWSRKEIDGDGVLKGRGLEIAWVDDPTELFFLHIQGSGRIRLPDGAIVTVGYAGSNGRPFRSIAPYMAEQGIMPTGSLSYWSIREYLNSHPEERQGVLNWNERYIFFRILEGEPVGSLGVPVTAGRSIAVDPGCFPSGAAAFIRARKPVADETGKTRWTPFSRFVLAQDAGAAIKGPGRLDLFCGAGYEAERKAGSLKEKGELYFLFPRPR
ncbi:MAG TPA: MltA domain-containing protein [Syntrophales bacterium]|nr:MltA domain-containing protein [Syntrophales bacterium]